MKKWAIYILLIFFIFLPIFVKAKYPLHLLIMVGIWSIAASGLNLILGYTGQASLGHAAFFGIGAYASALLMIRAGFSFWLALPLASLVAAFFGFLIGLPALRTRGSYFAIATLGFNLIVTIIIEHWEGLTQGGAGISGIPKPEAIHLPFGGKVAFTSMAAQYYLVLFFLTLTLVLIHRLIRSPVGKTYMAIRGGEALAESLGVHPLWNKLVSFTTSAFFAGLAGTLYASYHGFISPDTSNFHIGFDLLIYLLVGGVATLPGPIIGAIIMTIIPETLQFLLEYRIIFYGAFLVVIVIFLPRGLVGLWRSSIWPRVRRRVKGGSFSGGW
jgi:branched-chain amino acid transport system permease protein